MAKNVTEVVQGLQMLGSCVCNAAGRRARVYNFDQSSARPLVEQALSEAQKAAAPAKEALERGAVVLEGLRQGGPALAQRFIEDASTLWSDRSGLGRAAEEMVSFQTTGDPVAGYANHNSAAEEEIIGGKMVDGVYKSAAVLEIERIEREEKMKAAGILNMKSKTEATAVNAKASAEPHRANAESSAPRPSTSPSTSAADVPTLSAESRQRRVPVSRLSRMASYGTLGVGLGIGAMGEMIGRTFGVRDTGKLAGTVLSDNPFLTEANAERIVNTLCRVRGAALKLGQALSIQDNDMIHPRMQEIFQRVRDAADFMPARQLHKALLAELGAEWRERFREFDEQPFAAASIGQVHRATLHDGTAVALKVQYPGVAASINSDIDSLMTLLNFGQLLPKGLYTESFVEVARTELALECDYLREAECSRHFRDLVADDPSFYIPRVFDEHTTRNILCTELVDGVPLDACRDLDQATRDWIGSKMVELCLREVFEFRYMQSDPNWSNFFYDTKQGRISLLDFGATREYSKDFTDMYMRIIHAAAVRDPVEIIEHSKTIGFLTGYEAAAMEKAHADAVMILGEPFESHTPLDFGKQDISKRITALLPTMMKHRLTPPPPETYSIHRKLSGAFLLCTKLGSRVECKTMFDRIYNAYKFD